MKQYLTFFFRCYYPAGGMEDFAGDFDTLDEAIDTLTKLATEQMERYSYDELWDYDRGHVYDTVSMQIVWREGEAEKE